jgi:hypothetical protein
MKKRIFTLISAIVLALVLTVPALAGIADGGAVYISSLNMNVTLPEGMYYATRDVQEGDEYLELLDMSRDEFIEAMEEIDEHLIGNITSNWAGVDIWVSDDDYGLEFADMSREELEDDFAFYIQSLNDAGAETYDEEIVFVNGLGYEVFSFDRQTDDGLYGDRWYVTLHNGMSYTIALTSYDGPLSDEDKKTIAAIVDSIVFLDDAPVETPEQTAPAVEPTPAVMPWDTLNKTPGYVGESIVEPETGVRLTVPENWVMKDARDGELLRLVYRYDRTAVMTLSAEELSGVSDKRGWIGERTGVDYRDVEYVARNGKTCYLLEREVDGEKRTELYVFEDDRVYIYSLTRGADDKFAPELDELVSSAVYPARLIKREAPVERSLTESLILSLFLTILVYTVPVAVYRGVRGRPMERKKAKRAVTAYAIFAVLVLTAITYISGSGDGLATGGLLLWSWVNYKILTRDGGDKDKEQKEPALDKSIRPYASRPQPASPSGSFATTYSAASENSCPKPEPAEAQQKSGPAAPPREPARPISRAIPMPDAPRPKPKPAPKPRTEPENEDDFFDDDGDWLEDEFFDDEAFDDRDAD